jgi:hypothetical protein
MMISAPQWQLPRRYEGVNRRRSCLCRFCAIPWEVGNPSPIGSKNPKSSSTWHLTVLMSHKSQQLNPRVKANYNGLMNNQKFIFLRGNWSAPILFRLSRRKKNEFCRRALNKQIMRRANRDFIKNIGAKENWFQFEVRINPRKCCRAFARVI